MCIKLNTIDDVYDFINIVLRTSGDVILKQKYYVVNGKSIMGIFSLDLKQPIALVINEDEYDKFERFKYE